MSFMAGYRTARIAEEIKRELSQMIRDELKDPRLQGLISLTHVEVTNDLRYAKVFISPFSAEEEKYKETLKGLENAAGYLRNELGKRLRLRYTPELIFNLDNSIKYGSKIAEILEDIKIQEGVNTNNE